MTTQKHLSRVWLCPKNYFKLFAGQVLTHSVLTSYEVDAMWAPVNSRGTKTYWDSEGSYISRITQLVTRMAELCSLASWPTARALNHSLNARPSMVVSPSFLMSTLCLDKRNSPTLVLSGVEWGFLGFFFQLRRRSFGEELRLYIHADRRWILKRVGEKPVFHLVVWEGRVAMERGASLGSSKQEQTSKTNVSTGLSESPPLC